MKPSISFLVFTHNEGPGYLRPLFEKLISLKDPDDKIVVVDDYSSDQYTIDCIKQFSIHISHYQHHLDNDFAAHKNWGKDQCKEDIIMQIDGDELPHDNLIKTIKETFLMNRGLHMLRVPRINIVQGLTQDDVHKYGWQINENGYINFPDYQDRIFLNAPEIKWEGKVHEKIVGWIKHGELPAVDDYCLIHVKDIDRQRKQNELYNTITR